MEEEKKKATRKIVQAFNDRMYRYTEELIVCGKAGCSKCPHGPYWYVRWKQGDRIVTKYIGKVLKLIRPKGEKGKNEGKEPEGPGNIAGTVNTMGGERE